MKEINKVKLKDVLFAESNLCRNCGVIMNMDNNFPTADNFCTIQHNLPKYHNHYNKDKTIWCYKCNQIDSTFKTINGVMHKDNFIKRYKFKHQKLNGAYLIDECVFMYKNNELVNKQNIIYFKLDKLAKYINLIIEKKYFKDFDTFFNTTLKGKTSIKEYCIKDGWYKINANYHNPIQLTLNL